MGKINPRQILGTGRSPKDVKEVSERGSGRGTEKPSFSSAERCLALPPAAPDAHGERGSLGMFIALNFPLCYLPSVRKCSRTGNTAAILSPG